MTGKNFKITAEIVNGICPTCDEYTPLVGITKQFFRCLTCGSDLEQKVNGKISYIPHLTSKTLKMSDVENISMAKRKFTNFVPRPKPRKRPRRHTKSLNKHKKRSHKPYNRQGRKQ